MVDLALSRVSNQSLAVSKSHIGGCRSVPLVVCNDLHLGIKQFGHNFTMTKDLQYNYNNIERLTGCFFLTRPPLKSLSVGR